MSKSNNTNSRSDTVAIGPFARNPVQLSGTLPIHSSKSAQNSKATATVSTVLGKFRSKDFAAVGALMERGEYEEALLQFRKLDLFPATVEDSNALILLLIRTNQGQEALNEYQRMIACGLNPNEYTYVLLAQLRTHLNVSGQIAYLEFLRKEITARKYNPFFVACCVFVQMCSRMNALYDMYLRRQLACNAGPASGNAPIPEDIYVPILNAPIDWSTFVPVQLQSLLDFSNKLTPNQCFSSPDALFGDISSLPIASAESITAEERDRNASLKFTNEKGESLEELPVVDYGPVEAFYSALKAIGAEGYFLIFNVLVDRWGENFGYAKVDPKQSVSQYLELKKPIEPSEKMTEEERMKELARRESAIAKMIATNLKEMCQKMIHTYLLPTLLDQMHVLTAQSNLFIYNSHLECYTRGQGVNNRVFRMLERLHTTFDKSRLVYCYHMLVWYCLRWNLMQDAKKLIGEIRDISPEISKSIWEIGYYAKLNQEHSAMQALRAVEKQEKERLAALSANKSAPTSSIAPELYIIPEWVYNLLIEMFGRTGNEAELCRLYSELTCRGVKATSHTLNLVIDFFAKRGMAAKAERVFALARASETVVPDHVTWNILADMYVKANDHEKAMKIVQSMEDSGFFPTCVTYNILLDLHSKAGDYVKALEVWNTMLKKSIEPDTVTLHVLIFMFGKLKMPERAFEFYEDLKRRCLEPGLHLHNMLIGLRAKALEEKEALALFNEMMNVYKLKPEVYTYNPLLTMYSVLGKFKEMMALFNHMVAGGIEPDILCYNIVFHSFSKPGSELIRKEAPRLFAEMKRFGIDPPAHIYSSVIAHYCLHDEQEQALEIFAEVEARGYLQPLPYILILKQYLKRREYSKMAVLWEKMRKLDMSLDERAFTLMMHVYANAPKEKHVMKLLEEMKSLGLRPDMESYHALTVLYIRTRQPEKIVALYEEMQQCRVSTPTDQDCHPAMLNLFHACCRTNHVEYVLQLYADLFPPGVQVKHSPFAALFKLCYMRNDSALAQRFCEEAKLRGIALTEEDYSFLIKANASGLADPSARGRAYELLMEMKEKNMTLSRTAWIQLVRLQALVPQFDRMMDLYEWMKKDDEMPLNQNKRAAQLLKRTRSQERMTTSAASTPTMTQNIPADKRRDLDDDEKDETSEENEEESMIEAFPFSLYYAMLRACLWEKRLEQAAYLLREMLRVQVPVGPLQVKMLCTLFRHDQAFFFELLKLMNKDSVVNSIVAKVLRNFVKSLQQESNERVS